MAISAMLQRFMEKAPLAVMVRSMLEHIFSPEALDDIFAKSAQRQVSGELLFSSVVDLLASVVQRQHRSIGEAYRRSHEKFSVSVRSVYNKLNGTEVNVCRAMVRVTSLSLIKIVDVLSKGRKPTLAGYHVRIIDGNHLTSTDHRLKVLRTTRSGPLPGQALAVLDPDRMLIVDIFPCEDGEAQERRIFSEVIPTAQPRDLWIADRNFCTTGFLFGLAERGASFVIRQHASTLTWENETKQKKTGRCKTGILYEQKLYLKNGDKTLVVRRITNQLDKPTRDGETEIYLLTNLPQRDANAARVAELYLDRWTIENAFQELEQAMRSEINTLGYPGAALLGFSIGVITYNAISVVKWAIEREHGEVIERKQLSGYYMAAAVSEDYGGMMIALPESIWTKHFAHMSTRQLAAHLRACARHIRPDAIRKNHRAPKKKRPPSSSGKIHHHVSTAKLLALQK